MKCNYCGMELSNGETVCPNCGGPVQSQPSQQRSTKQTISIIKQHLGNERQCNKIVYIILAIFFGTLGIHDFYAKYYVRGIIKIVLTLTFIGVYISLIWSIIDAFKIRQTKDGRMFI